MSISYWAFNVSHEEKQCNQYLFSLELIQKLLLYIYIFFASKFKVLLPREKIQAPNHYDRWHCQSHCAVHTHCTLLYTVLNMVLSKRQQCMMGRQSAGPLKTFPLRCKALFDVCCSKHSWFSPNHSLLRDETQHKNTNERIRRKP